MFRKQIFRVRGTQDLHSGNGLVDEHKELFHRIKEIVYGAKIDGEQRTVYSNFANNILFVEKIILSPYWSCSRIVYSGLYT